MSGAPKCAFYRRNVAVRTLLFGGHQKPGRRTASAISEEVVISEVFLSYANPDRQDVSDIASTLHSLGVDVWFDQWMLVPGLAWQPVLAQAVLSSQSTAIFVGPSGTGPWQQAEAMLAMDRALKDQSYRLIPVLLPDAPPSDRIEMPAFLKLFTWVDFRGGLKEADPLRRLLAGIKGRPPGPVDSELSQCSPKMSGAPSTSNVSYGPSDEKLLADALSTIGLPREASLEIAQRFQRASLDRWKLNDPSVWALNSHEQLKLFNLDEVVRDSARQFLDDWILWLNPPRQLGRSFYLSREKVTKTYRAYKSALIAHFTVGSFESDTAEDKFLALERYFLETGSLVFLPALFLAGRGVALSADPIIYFVGTFTLEQDLEFDTAFPFVMELIRAGKATRGLVNSVFDHPDPYTNPYITLSGYLGQWAASMTLSRKFVRVASMTVDHLFQLLKGMPVVIAGTASVERSETGELLLQPIACHFSRGQRWLHPVSKTEAEHASP